MIKGEPTATKGDLQSHTVSSSRLHDSEVSRHSQRRLQTQYGTLHNVFLSVQTASCSEQSTPDMRMNCSNAY